MGVGRKECFPPSPQAWAMKEERGEQDSGILPLVAGKKKADAESRERHEGARVCVGRTVRPVCMCAEEGAGLEAGRSRGAEH